MSYWSEASISSQTFDIVSREELKEALAWADHAATQANRAEKHASHLQGIITMAPKCHLAFTPAPRQVTRSSTSEEQSEYTPSTSTSIAQEPLPPASTPPTAEPLSSCIIQSDISQSHTCGTASIRAQRLAFDGCCNEEPDIEGDMEEV
ncbi:hypothetical protein COCNU_scaffold043140G000010 [Cocos nucifera]|nr:hypothetical protein [Cocos nucifera]